MVLKSETDLEKLHAEIQSVAVNRIKMNKKLQLLIVSWFESQAADEAVFWEGEKMWKKDLKR